MLSVFSRYKLCPLNLYMYLFAFYFSLSFSDIKINTLEEKHYWRHKSYLCATEYHATLMQIHFAGIASQRFCEWNILYLSMLTGATKEMYAHIKQRNKQKKRGFEAPNTYVDASQIHVQQLSGWKYLSGVAIKAGQEEEAEVKKVRVHTTERLHRPLASDG